MLRRQIGNPGVYIYAALVNNTVAGFAIWAAPANNQRPISALLRMYDMLLMAYDQIRFLVFPSLMREYFDPYTKYRRRRRKIFMKEDGATEYKITPKEIKEQDYWQLTALGVSNDFGRRGIGSALLEWGTQKADEGDKAIMVTASIEGEKLYTRHEFQVIHRAALLKSETENGSGIPQTYMIRWPRSERKTASGAS